MELFEITTSENKTISLVADVWQVITQLNVLNRNTDQGLFEHNAETGEITIKRNSLLKISGYLFLVNADEETPSVQIMLSVNGIKTYFLYTGSNYGRLLTTSILTCLQGDVITFEIVSPETIDLETNGINTITIETRLK